MPCAVGLCQTNGTDGSEISLVVVIARRCRPWRCRPGGADAGVQVDLIGRMTCSTADLGEWVYLACSSAVRGGIALTIGPDLVPEIACVAVTSVILTDGVRRDVDLLAGRHVQHSGTPGQSVWARSINPSIK